MRRAVVLGGTGAIGGAVAVRLAANGWDVHVTGRDPARMPAELTLAGVHFHALDRADLPAIAAVAGDGMDLLVDLVAFCADDVRTLLPVMSAAASTVLVSSRAVYADADGRHLNGPQPPRFEVPIGEDNATVPAAGSSTDPFSRAGYGPSKVAAERAALDSGLPVTVLRPSKVHGRWARNPRTADLVGRMLRGEPVTLADWGDTIENLTAAANAAALVEVVADAPGSRILNIADPDAPSAAQIVAAIAAELGWDGPVTGLDPSTSPTSHPVVLDTSAARALGYQPVDQGIVLLADEVRWLASSHGPAA